MAPYSFSTLHQTRTERDPIKLRKPIVEKMRRDRINGCIEQLKVLLEKELRRKGCPKLEKADVLEMTVCFLKQQLQGHTAPSDAFGTSHMEAHREAHMEVHREAHMEVHRDAHMEVHKEAHMEVHREGHMEVHREAHMEVQPEALRPHMEAPGASQKEVHTLPQTWLQGSPSSLQPTDTAPNSAPMWRPW